MGVPTQAKLSVFIASLNVSGISWIFGLSPLNVQSNANLAVLRGGEFALINPVGPSMSLDFVVGADVSIVPYARDTRGSISSTVTSGALNCWLIEGYP